MSRTVTTDGGVAAFIKKRSAERFLNGRKAEQTYSRQLRSVARQVNSIVKTFAQDGSVDDLNSLISTLNRYAEILRPWARKVGWGMVSEVSRRDEAAWFEHGQEMGRALRKEIKSAPTGNLMRDLLTEQVELITSLPTEAAQRVHELTTESLINGSRASEIAKEILRTGDVTEARATLIARTETARTAAALTQVRAQHAGSLGYIWHTAQDSDVRHSHAEMNGRYVPWDKPPTFVEGVHKKTTMTGHAGCFPNCRCFSEPLF